VTEIYFVGGRLFLRTYNGTVFINNQAITLFEKEGEKIKRCQWADGSEIYEKYHDEEWGVPTYDDDILFEFLILEGFQAGLSWLTVLKKRENFRKAFDNFNARKVANYGPKKIDALLKDTGIIRNKQKIQSAITNARAFLEVQKDVGSFSDYMWSFMGGKPLVNQWKKMKQIPAKTELADIISRDLKARGFKFVGSTICYAFMQAVGMVNDHVTYCFRYEQIKNSG